MNDKKIKFIHISDLHYENTYDGDFILRLISLTKLSPTDMIVSALQKIIFSHKDIDFVLISGDITQEGSVEEYFALKTLIENELNNIPVFVALGNHDTDNFFKGYLGRECPNNSYHYSTVLSGIRIIVLDSRGGEYESGKLKKEQIEWLKKELSKPAERGSILVLHHTPHISGEEENLVYQNENSLELYNAVKESDVKAIFAGHTHKNYYTMLGNIPCYTVKSIAFGIETFMEKMEINNDTGYHYCELDESGNISVNSISIIPEEFLKVTFMYDEME